MELNYKTIDVHISTIKIGDIIFHDEKIRTVGIENLKYCKFMGITIYGDSYNLGYKKVKLIQFLKKPRPAVPGNF